MLVLRWKKSIYFTAERGGLRKNTPIINYYCYSLSDNIKINNLLIIDESINRWIYNN